MKKVALWSLGGFLLFIYFDPAIYLPVLAQIRAALLMALLALAAAILSGGGIPRAPQNWLLGAYVICAWIATQLSVSPVRSADKFPILFKAVALYFVVAMIVRSADRLRQFAFINIVLGSIISVVTILTTRAGISPLGGGDLYRMVNYFGGIGDDPNEFGAFMLALMPLPIMLARAEKSKVKKVLLAIATLSFLMCITRTRSRGAFIGLLTMAPFLFWEARRSIGGIIIGALLVGYTYTNTHAGYWDRVATAFDDEAIEEDFSATSRLFQQQYAMELIEMRPFFGIGPGAFVEAKIRLLGLDPDAKLTLLAAHNAYLGLCSEIGIPGFSILVLSLVVTIFSLRKSEKLAPIRAPDTGLDQIAKAMRIGLMGFCVSIFFLTEQYNPVLYMWMAVSVALQDILRRPAAVEARPPAQQLAGARAEAFS